MNLTKLEEHKIETERYSVTLTIYEDPINGDFIGEIDGFPSGCLPRVEPGEDFPVFRMETLPPEYDSNKEVLIGRCREIIEERFGGIEGERL